MNYYRSTNFSKGYGYQKVLVLLTFLAGILNAQQYFSFLGLRPLTSSLVLFFYGLLLLSCFLLVISMLYKGSGFSFKVSRYWLLLFIAVGLKFVILFIQYPASFLPGNELFNKLLIIPANILLTIVLCTGLATTYYLKASIWAMGLGTSLATIIPIIFFPEMIGNRLSTIENYFFNGSFWNPSVISYISVGWLLVALASIENSKIKQRLLMGTFLLIMFGCLAGLSRAALLSILLSSIIYLWKSKKITKYIKVIAGALALVFILVFFFQEIISNYSARFEGGFQIQDETRSVIWRDYLETEDIANYLLFGELQGDYTKYSEGGFAPHSVFLNWFSQFGILGLIGFLLLLIGILIAIKQIRTSTSNQTAAALYAWLVGYLSVASINETGFDDLTVFGAFGIVLAWGRLTKKTSV